MQRSGHVAAVRRGRGATILFLSSGDGECESRISAGSSIEEDGHPPALSALGRSGPGVQH